MKTVAIKSEKLTKKQRMARYCVGFSITIVALTFIKAISYMLVNPNGNDYTLYPFLLHWDIIFSGAIILWAFIVFIIEAIKRD